jgi:hypothetical protein
VVCKLEDGGEGAFGVWGDDLGYGYLRVFDFFVHLSPFLGVEVQQEKLCLLIFTSYFFIDSLIPPEKPFRSSILLMIVFTPFYSSSRDSYKLASHFASISFSLMAKVFLTSSKAFWI